MGTLIVKPQSRLVLRVKTDNLSAGSTANNQFQIPHRGTGTYNYRVNWGDGTTESITGNTSPTHTYTSIGTYNIRIKGEFAGFLFNNGGDRLKLLDIPVANREGFEYIGFGFRGCANLASIPFFKINGTPDPNWGIDNSFRYVVDSCTSLTSFPLIDTSAIKNFEAAWKGTSIVQFPSLDISNGIMFHATWQQIPIVSMPLLNPVNAIRFSSGWWNCTSLVDFPSGFFDNWVGSPDPASGCFGSTWAGCTSLSAQSVENILVSIDNSGRIAPGTYTGTMADISITYNVATGSLSGAANTAITNLKAKGWKPYINNVYV